MKKLFLFAATLFAALPTNAQVTFGDDDNDQEENIGVGIQDKRTNAVAFGFKVGANISTMSKYKPIDLDQKSGTGFEAGIVLSARFGKRTKASDAGTGMLGVQIEPSFAQHAIGTIDENLKLSYFEVPMLLKIFVTPNLNIEIGPNICGTLSASPDYIEAEDIRIATGDLKGFDVRACVGISYEMKEGLFASLRYQLGSSDLAGNFPCKVNTASLTLGYKFNIFKF